MQTSSCTVRLSKRWTKIRLQPRCRGLATAVMAHFKVKPVVGGVERHCANRLACQQLIIWPYRHASQSRQHRIVTSGDLQDQDLSALMVRAGIKNLAVG